MVPLFDKQIKLKLGVLIAIGIVGNLVSLLIPMYMTKLIDGTAHNSLFMTSSAIMAIVLVHLGLVSLSNYLLYKQVEQSVTQFNIKTYQHLIRTKEQSFTKHNSTELASNLFHSSENIRQFFAVSVLEISNSVITIVAVFALLLVTDWLLTVVALVLLPLILVVIAPLSAKSAKYTERYNEAKSGTLAKISEFLIQRKTIKVTNTQEASTALVGEQLTELAGYSIKGGFLESIAKPLTLSILILLIAIIFFFGGYRVTVGAISIGQFVSFLVYVFMLLTPVSSVGQFFNALGKYKGSRDFFEDIWKYELESTEGESVELANQIVTLENVSFSYGIEQPPVLNQLSLAIEPQQVTALVGPSGVGKSTIIQLLLRLYDVESGAIRLGEQNIQDVNLGQWRDQLAWVAQDNWLLNTTIRDNLLFGLSTAVTEETLWQVLAQVGLKEEVQGFEAQLDTVVGEMGSNLSGGQKQRLQIAKALLKQPKFLIFDEATANLDSEAEQTMNELVSALRERTTIFLVTHRLSTSQKADKIYFIDESGAVTGQGTHEQLMATHARYKTFVENQMIQ